MIVRSYNGLKERRTKFKLIQEVLYIYKTEASDKVLVF